MAQLSHPAQAHLLMNIVTLSGRHFPHQSCTLSHTDIATSHSDEGTPSTEAPSDDCSSEIMKCWQIYLSLDYVSLWIEKSISYCPPPLLAFNINQQSLLNITKRSIKEATLCQHYENLDRKM